MKIENWNVAKAIAVLALLGGCCQTVAEIRLPNIFGSHMVLQRLEPIHVWGTASSGEGVDVSLHHQSVQTQADATGKWRVALQPELAGGPYILTVRGENVIEHSDVMVGDVWFASGQSNMEWSVRQSRNAIQEIAESRHPGIRHFKVPKGVAFEPASGIGTADWKVSGPEDSGDFSAVGYFFAKRLHLESGVAIGIVNASWGGTNIETWMSPDAIARLPGIDTSSLPANATELRTQRRRKMTEQVARWQPGFGKQDESPTSWNGPGVSDLTWNRMSAPGVWEEQGLEGLDGVVWYRRSVVLTAAQASSSAVLNLGMIDDCDETFVNGTPVGQTCGWDTPRKYRLSPNALLPGRNLIAVRVTDTGGAGGFHGEPSGMKLELDSDNVPLAGDWKARVESVLEASNIGPNDLPGLAYNAMVHPLHGLPMRGVIWYQGEGNVTRAKQYGITFPSLIDDWRHQWNKIELPFYFVQLASFRPLATNSLVGSKWAELRESQRLALTLSHTGMVVTTDVGDANDIHPKDKQSVGIRLALHALKNEYQQPGLVVSGPVYKSSRRLGSRIEIAFFSGTGKLVSPSAPGRLQGFTIADEHGEFRQARARISGQRILVSHPTIKKPTAVRYGWLDNPQENNLVNEFGLPASPFRTDHFSLLTEDAAYRQ